MVNRRTVRPSSNASSAKQSSTCRSARLRADGGCFLFAKYRDVGRNGRAVAGRIRACFDRPADHEAEQRALADA
jgi:hypothetical protein